MKSQRNDQNLDLIDKIPPQAIDIEEIVLGSLMYEKQALVEVIDQLTEETFYDPKHQVVFRAIKDIYQNSAVDILTVTNRLRDKEELEGVGGAYFISQLTNRVAGTGHIQEWVLVIREKYIQREIIRLGCELQKRGFENTDDVFDLIEFAEKSILDLQPKPRKSNELRDISQTAIQEIYLAKESGTTGISTGFHSIDRLTGLVNTNLFILSARPGMGKSSLALCIARNVANTVPVGVFSLEMSDSELYKRLLSMELNIPLQRIIRGDLTEYESDALEKENKSLRELPIYIDDNATMNIFELKSKARRWYSKYGIGLLIVDYLQLMGGKQDGNREQEVSSISRALKQLAKELGIPVMALSQLSRKVESRADQRPILSDLRESGAIEQDADVVLFLYRNTDKNHEAVEPIIAKNRNGKTGSGDPIKFIGSYTKFENYSQQEIEEIQPF